MRRLLSIMTLLLCSACTPSSGGTIASSGGATTAAATPLASSLPAATSSPAISAASAMPAVPAPTATTAPSPAPAVPSATASPRPLPPTATSAAGSRPAGSTAVGTAGAPSADWPTYHRDPGRRGVDPSAGSLASVKARWQSTLLDGQIYAEPLVTGNRVFVATENDTVYALDATSGATIWQAHLGTPVPGDSLPCGDVDPVGITGTPVVDAAHGMLFAAAFEEPGKDVLVALRLDTGAVVWQRAIDPPSDDPHALNQRSALTLANDTVYVPFGGRDGDCSLYHGWVVGSPTNGVGALRSYQVPTRGGGGPSDGGGGIWAPGGMAADAAGNLFVATGNGGSTSFDYSDSVIKLSPGLQALDYFAPANWATLSRTDRDLGSAGPVLLENGLVFVVGKEGVGYLLQAGQLGHIGGQAFAAAVCNGSGAFGAVAYAAPFLYVPCTNGLTALRVGSGPAFTVAWRGPTIRAGAPIVAGGAVWSMDRGGTLYGFDPASGQVRAQLQVGASSTSFPSLAAAGGSLFVPAGQRLIAFGAA